MECIKSAARSALVAFAPDAPYLAAGTMAGAVDLSFSSSANLEIFELDFKSDARDLPVVGACASSERFNRLSWSKSFLASEEYGLGLVAGGWGDGSIGVWNPRKLIGSEDQNNAFVAKLEKHTGAVRGLEFSVLAPNLLASGADEGELCIWDLAKPVEPTLFPSLKSTGSGARTEVSFVSWNPKFQHILASTSYNGMTVVWDLRQQKTVTSFSDSIRRSCSVVRWNPDISTQLIVASDDDSSPSLRVWDLRKTISPLRELVGHTKGVIAMSWCPHDSSFLLTCAKDNRTICWDTSGEIVCELPASTNMNFDVHWYPRIPGVISASSFDVKIGIYNIQAYNRFLVGEGVLSTPVRLRAPKWLKRPVGASFGFGGKLVSFQPSPSAPSSSSEVYVHKLVTEQSLVSRSSEFEAAIQGGEKTSLRLLCEKKSQESLSEDEKETWGFMKVMFEEEGTARTKLLNHLGFDVPNGGTEDAIDEVGNKLTNSFSFDEKASKGAFFAGEEGNANLIDNGDEFFNNIQPPDDNFVVEDNEVSSDNQIKKEPEEYGESTYPSIDDSIQRALVVGDCKGAVLLCIAAKRMGDALVIAHVGGPSLWEITRDQYLKNSVSPYLKVVSAMVTNDLVSIVNTRPLDSWKETLALLCTLAQKEEWTILCDTLASRLMSVGNILAATLSYICAGNIDKTVEIWSRSLKIECEGKTFVDLLQDLMEKTIVLALATGQKHFSASLSKLVEIYAELLASQGLLTTSMEYLKLLGSEESSHELAILRDRIAVSVAEREALPTAANYVPQQVDVMQDAEKPSYGAIDGSQYYYQPRASIPSGSYGDGYQYGYQPASQSVEQKPSYSNPAPFQPTQPAFIPSHPHSNPLQSNFPAAPVPAQPVVRPFTPATPPVIKNVNQYQQPQQPSVESHLYPGGSNHTHPSAPPGLASGAGVPQPGQVPGQMFPHTVATAPSAASRGFMPVTNPGFVQRPSFSPQQPSSPTQPAQAQPVVAPPAPPPTVQTVDTSNVPAELRPVITTLTRLFNETSQALGGSHASASKKREIEDNSRKIGALFAKLNSSDISPNAAAKLSQLCQALDIGDFPSALHIQVVLTTSDWDECNFWLAALKRMIKTRQSVRI